MGTGDSLFKLLQMIVVSSDTLYNRDYYLYKFL
jgi:hypothetical protein